MVSRDLIWYKQSIINGIDKDNIHELMKIFSDYNLSEKK